MFTKQKIQTTAFLKRLAKLLTAHVPLDEALGQMLQQRTQPTTHDFLNTLLSGIQMGKPLSAVLAAYPHAFSTYACAIVQAGEESGQLSAAIARLSDMQQAQQQFHRRLKKAITYPITILTCAGMLTLAMLVFILPQFEQLFQSYQASLPPFTAYLLTLSHSLQQHGLFILGLICLCTILASILIQYHQPTRTWLEWCLQTVPGIRSVTQTVLTRNLAYLMYSLQSAAVPVYRTLILCRDATPWHSLKASYHTLIERIAAGETLSTAMAALPFLDEDCLSYLAVGESANTLAHTFEQLYLDADAYVQDTLEQATKFIEPICMVGLALLIGSVIIGMYLPIFKLSSVI